ncbi:MAG: hypothetical protein R2762_12385 [Bryobacteraceae bacterium]
MATGISLGATLALWGTSSYDISETSVGAAFLLLLIPSLSYAHWKNSRGASIVPLFAAVALMHWVYFGLPLFWGSRRVGLRFLTVVSEESVSAVMLMALLGVVSFCAGCWLVPVRRSAGPWTDVEITPRARQYLYTIVIAGTLVNGTGSISYSLGEAGRQLILVFTSTVPSVALVILLREQMAGRGGRMDRYLIGGALAGRAVLGIATGWAGSLVFLAMLYMAVFLAERRKLPVPVLLATVSLLLFLQAGKTDFRVNYWYGGGSGGPVDRIEYWVNASWHHWKRALDEPGAEGILRLQQRALMRVSLLEQAANVLDRTPSLVEFQKGATYSHLAVTFIPRFLWPTKPSVNEANHFYQLNYGFSTLRDLDRVSIAVGYLTEGYINFGYPGVAGVMFGVGLLLGLYERTLLSPRAGILWTALGISLAHPVDDHRISTGPIFGWAAATTRA